MNRIKLFYVLMLVLCLGMSFSASANSVQVITFGDSITAGTYSFGNTYRCPVGVSGPIFLPDPRPRCIGNGLESASQSGGYQPVLRSLMLADGMQPLIYNYGYASELTSQMVSRLPGVLNARPNAKFVLILGGANDALRGFGSSTVKTNLAALVTRAKNAGIEPILAKPTPNLAAGGFSALIPLYGDRVEEIGSEQGIDIVDLYTALSTPSFSGYHSGDNLHLNSAGNSKMAEAWFAGLKRAMGAVPLGGILLLLLDE